MTPHNYPPSSSRGSRNNRFVSYTHTLCTTYLPLNYSRVRPFSLFISFSYQHTYHITSPPALYPFAFKYSLTLLPSPSF